MLFLILLLILSFDKEGVVYAIVLSVLSGILNGLSILFSTGIGFLLLALGFKCLT